MDNAGVFHTCSAHFRCEDVDVEAGTSTVVEVGYCECEGIEEVVQHVLHYLERKEQRRRRELKRFLEYRSEI